MSAPLNIVLVGIHGAGKTTIGTLLARELAIPYHCEIGKTLRRKMLRSDAGYHALNPDATFDERVMLCEMLRDINATSMRVIETWHPGNLAFACERSPAIYERYRPLLDAHIKQLRGTTLVQPLIITEQTARSRQSEYGDDAEQLGAYFQRVADRTTRFVDELGLITFEPLATDNLAPHLCAQRISVRIRAIHEGRPLVLN